MPGQRPGKGKIAPKTAAPELMSRAIQRDEQYSAVARRGGNMAPQIENVVCGRGCPHARVRRRVGKRWNRSAGDPPACRARNALPHLSQCRSSIPRR
jgi:hypothetical protein